MKSKLNLSAKFFAISVALLLLFRAVMNALLPLMDKTEARYAEIARIMAETNNWITPQIDYNIPFWAKPPLSTWLSAMSFEMFGVSEFTARLPYLVLATLLVFLVGKYAKREQLPFFLPGFILLTIPQFFLHAGVVSTDTSLAFCVALVLLSFWESIKSPTKTIWRYLIFVGFGLGLLAKGPIIFILTIPPLFIWCFIFKKFKLVFKTFPWVLGIVLMLLISIPWYYFAEKKTPGFIDYFIVGEHFKRFFDSGWKGDKYGYPKTQPFGIIWLFLIVFTIPWIVALLSKTWKNKTTIFKNEWVAFLLLWLLWTPLFFTVSSSLIHPYIMPVMVPVALLITHWWKTIKNTKLFVRISLAIPILILCVYVIGVLAGKKEFYANSDKYLIEHQITDDKQLYHYKIKSYSGQFYTRGNIKAINNIELESELKNNNSFLIIIPFKNEAEIPESIMEKLELIESYQRKGIYKPL